ncbi:MAG: sulfotransferase, partial [Bacteroidetes bacterium]|nr:sulfotransferase [Bacteroidota bacterium]
MVHQIDNKYINLNPSELLPSDFRHPVFVLGLMRSGTSLLLNILSEHPQLLKIGVELNSIWTQIGGACCQGECHYKTAKDVKPEYVVNMTNYFRESIFYYRSGRQAWKRFLFSRKYGSGGISKDWDQIIPVNKSPHLSNKALYLHEMFPESKFILIIRSIQSHSYSLKRHFEKDYEKRKLVNYLPQDGKNCWTRMWLEDLADKDQNRIFPSNFSLIPEA